MTFNRTLGGRKHEKEYNGKHGTVNGNCRPVSHAKYTATQGERNAKETTHKERHYKNLISERQANRPSTQNKDNLGQPRPSVTIYNAPLPCGEGARKERMEPLYSYDLFCPYCARGRDDNMHPCSDDCPQYWELKGKDYHDGFN